MTGFTRRLRKALVGSPDAAVVLLGNFEVEEQWARGEHTLPRFSAAAGTAVVNRMDEFAMLLAAAGDHVVLKTAPDPAYVDYLRALGLELPTVHVVSQQDPQRTVTEDILRDNELLARLSTLDASIAVHGVSEVEEELAAATGLTLAAPSALVCKAVNSKVYSRRLADELGLRQPDGRACDTLEQLAAAVEWARGLLATGRRVVLKEAFGVSGKGIAVLDSERRLDRTYRMIADRVHRRGDERIAFVLEDWVDKASDLNYQFTVSRDGSVSFDFVKEAITENGVHKGHWMPADLSGAHVDQLTMCADLLGKRLAEDGYFGVVGVDALTDPAGGLYPVIEINARNNMSTYQVLLQERFLGVGRVAMARHYPLRLAEPLGFADAARLLDGLLLSGVGGSGLLVNNFATVNAGARAEGPFDGRLYGLLIADTAAEVAVIDAAVTARLAEGIPS
ncbi:ATP-grasp domain-containing protein [Protofrankia coriariae]|nr:ATP-grasp domain-containing protein [Protofrankia coriariae]